MSQAHHFKHFLEQLKSNTETAPKFLVVPRLPVSVDLSMHFIHNSKYKFVPTSFSTPVAIIIITMRSTLIIFPAPS